MTAAKKGSCPICGREAEVRYRPFCSKRCADIDLGRWFNERYVVPEPFDPDMDEPEDDEKS